MAKVRVEYTRDQRDAWVFRVPALGIVGSGVSREEARRRAFDAIALTLEVAPDERPADEAEYVGLIATLTWPASSSSVKKRILLAVAGACRVMTRPPTRISRPAGHGQPGRVKPNRRSLHQSQVGSVLDGR